MKSTRTIRLFAILLSLIMILPLFAACNKASENQTTTDYTTEARNDPPTTEGSDPSDNGTEEPPVDPDPDFSVPQNASVYSGTPDTSWYTGDKTEYVLTTADQFVGMNKLRQDSKGTVTFEGVTVKLGTDMIINQGTMEEIVARGNSNHSLTELTSSYLFKGTFDGQGHVISGIYMEGATSGVHGIFGEIGGNAVIKNLVVANGYITCSLAGGNESVGCIASKISGENANVTISDVDAQVMIKDTEHKANRVGGFVGNITDAISLTMENCRFYGEITISGNEAGGLIGSMIHKKASITLKNCKNYANITAAKYAGGLIGKCMVGFLNESECENNANITADAYAGSRYGAGSAYQDPTDGARPNTPDGYSALRVLSFNVQDSLTKSGDDLTQSSQNRMDAITQEILHYAPDLIGLQEDNITVHENLKLEGYLRAPNSFTTGEYCAIYYKDNMTLLESGGLWLTATGNISSTGLTYAELTDPNGPYYMTPEELKVLGVSKTADLIAKKKTYYDKATQKQVSCSSYTVLTKRKATWTVFDVNGQPVIYVNTHLTQRSQNAVYSNDELQKIRSLERIKEYEIIQKKVAELKKIYPDAPVFMTGDWNNGEYTPIFNTVCGSGFSSAALIAQQRFGPLGSWNYAFDLSVQGDCYPQNESKEGTADSYADYCFVTPEIEVLKFRSGAGKAEITLADGTKKIIYTSDHLPIIADLCFKKS